MGNLENTRETKQKDIDSCYPKKGHKADKDLTARAKRSSTKSYVAYPKAMDQLSQRIGATPEEMAAWIFMTPQHGGLAAYKNANELNPAPRFFFGEVPESHDYMAPLMSCWFKTKDIERFNPTDRFITGAALMLKWGKRPGLKPFDFILAKIAESRLDDLHPIYGGTRGGSGDEGLPPLESGLFCLANVEQIEAEDFGQVSASANPKTTNIGTPEWRKQNATAAANVLHDKLGGSRDKKRQIREIWASGKYSSRDICAEQECAALDMAYSTARRALRNTPEPSRC